MNKKPFVPTTDYQAHMRQRQTIREAITELKEDGTPLPEVIEAVRNELQLLTIELDKYDEPTQTKSRNSTIPPTVL